MFRFESASESDCESCFHRVLYRESSVAMNLSVVTANEEQRKYRRPYFSNSSDIVKVVYNQVC
jgi:hypothetical protein